MALVRNIDAAVMTRDAIVLDLGDLRRQGQRLLDAARAEAVRIEQEAQADRATIIAGADKIGHDQGYARGLEEGRAAGIEHGTQQALAAVAPEVQRLNAGWAAALDGFLQVRERFLAEGQQDVVRLAAMIASKVCKRQIELDASIVAVQMAEVLSLVLRPTRLQVACHPDDRALLTRALPLLVQRTQHNVDVELVDDPSLARGSCVARLASGGGQIDASIDTQLQRIVDALLPPAAAGETE
ncbi:MAG TPA: FliH/SctL family protein [Phycisphaerales bacterium]|nr:FliH/SctL family protein [Phycisphaerales bacterium]